MASVQELLLAAQAKKSPFMALAEGLTQGIGQSQNGALDRVTKLMAIEEQRQAQERQRQLREEIDGKTEAGVKNSLKGAATPDAVTPQQKLEVTYSEGPNGITKTSKTPTERYQSRQYTDAQGKVRIGRFNPDTGELLQTVNDPLGTALPETFTVLGNQDGKPIVMGNKSKTVETVDLPGSGPLMSTTQTEGQANAKLYAERMEEADSQIGDLAKRYDLTSLEAAAGGKVWNFLKPEEIQLFEQSKRNFLNAVLRRESGAVISPSEMSEGDKQYFPVFGDTASVLEQKSKNRATATAGLRNAAGKATVAPKQEVKTKSGGGWTEAEEREYQALAAKLGGGK